MRARHLFIFLAGSVLFFLSFSNSFVGKSSALSASQTPPLPPTPIQTINVQTPITYPSSPKLTITPTNTNSENKQTTTPIAVQTPTPTPKKVETPTPKTTPSVSPVDSTKSSEGSWLPWIIAGILLAIIIFLLGRESKE